MFFALGPPSDQHFLPYAHHLISVYIGTSLLTSVEYNDFILKLQKREHDKRSIPILNQSGSPEMLGWLLDKANSVPDNVAIEWLIGAMVQIADRLQTRDDWAFEPVVNVEPQLRIVLRQLDSMTLKEMAVSFPWPTREMAGAEVLPIRSMKPEEKQKWLQNLWGVLKSDKTDLKSLLGRPASRSDADRRGRSPSPAPSASRFEAPRSTSPLPSNAGLKRTNATQSVRHGRQLSVPNGDAPRTRSPSPSPSRGGEVSLGRMLTVHKKPPENVLGDALSLALFRVQEGST